MSTARAYAAGCEMPASDPGYLEVPATPFSGGSMRSDTVSTAGHRPSRAEVAGAAGRTVPDLIAPGLAVLFCGINPGLYSAATGHHFARPGNRFWPALHAGGFTGRLLRPWEEGLLLTCGLGITNLVARATATAAELSADELRLGRRRLARKLRRYRPACLAVLGIGAYRSAFQRPRAAMGHQPEPSAATEVWVLPNPSGLNASHQLPDLAAAFADVRRFVAALESAPVVGGSRAPRQ
jgi:double-stranded uracil-DNA glycosylase